ncbi:lysophospholipid acyltransferase family protein [Aureibaculum sp. 2210JD6-5]|uniref:lysophospholipid acyltransferase family protein n=1 Tax=Aureibaculum sp. 2210JD6-5 TaxID=3103957 RepID=UPI002AADC953|nr:lysophospholipid acyltransferase family protein [Aureibaculum sp. 2210JD6-5]MDY7396605.1 lysophospholipid acyltransferase family protein [Aureibaculum sp. 2210JD6-5]
MKRIWYQLVKIYIRTGLFFFYKKIIIKGVKNIPKKGAVLLVSNHKNALIDPLLIATTNPRDIHFLTRASAFKIGFVKWILSTVNMLPIYRLRDGKETLAKNEEIFNQCFNILNKQRSLLIFPEGTHDIRRWVRPLSKGFTRIAFGVFEKHPNLQLHIVPVGLNYSKADKFAESVSIYYGRPVLANAFYDKNDFNGSAQRLKVVVSEKMKELTTHVAIEHYDETIEKLGNVDFLEPEKINKQILIPKSRDKFQKQSIEKSSTFKSPSFFWIILKKLVVLNSIIPLLIYKAIEPKIQEIEFVSTTKFAVGITAFPLFYVLQSLVINYFFGSYLALLYFGLSIMLVLILVKSK